ncbi:MAG: T9SS type A sorting domain-containing protein [Bacteroidetes bacterium]|nr:T9SS type A sorting domain-containing protein [Bacteroidota bacterium]
MIKNLITALIILMSGFLYGQQSECSKYKSKIIFNKNSVYTDIREFDYDVKYVKLDLKLTNKNQFISGNVFTKAVVVSASFDNWIFELHTNFTIDSIKSDSKKLSFTRNGNYITVKLDKTYTKGNIVDLNVYYYGFSPSGGFFNGYSSAESPTWSTRASWSLSEPFNAHQWWPSKQVLTDKIDSSDVWITCDTSQMGGSNGLLQKIVKFDTLHRFEWKNRSPIAYYLISVAVSNYIEYSFDVIIPGIAAPVLVQNLIYRNPQTLQNFKNEIDKTGDLLKFFSEKYGVYPFFKEKYGHCMAPFGGGMEHQTMTTLGTFNTSLTAHELAHQWFGDNVTCKTWKDIWINEGFARYSEVLYSEKTNPTYARKQMDEYHTSVFTAFDGSIFVDDTTNPSRIFSTRLTYNKGAAVIHSLRYEINNDSIFFEVLRRFQKSFSHKNASIADFRDFLQTNTKRNWNDFFDQWIYKEGYPTYNIHYRTSGKDGLVLIKQKTSKPASVAVFKGSIDLKIHLKNKDTLVRFKIESDSQLFVLKNSDSILVLEIDPNQWILNDTGYILYDTTLKSPPQVDIVNLYQNKKSKVFPNPCNEFVLIPSIFINKEWEIFDLNGRTIEKGKLDCSNKIDTSLLPEGIFSLKIENSYFKIIILHR